MNRDFSQYLGSETDFDSDETKLIQLQKHERINDSWRYGLWTYRVITDDVGGFSEKFTGPDAFICATGGKSASMTGISGYMYNYKEARIVLTYQEGNETAVTKAVAGGSGEYIPAVFAEPDSGKLVEAVYFFIMYSGGELADANEIAVVHVVDEDYARSEQYARNSYANLIDCYVYIETAKSS